MWMNARQRLELSGNVRYLRQEGTTQVLGSRKEGGHCAACLPSNVHTYLVIIRCIQSQQDFACCMKLSDISNGKSQL
jgi:hypothetical protein